jgi:hypothetical protein
MGNPDFYDNVSLQPDIGRKFGRITGVEVGACWPTRCVWSPFVLPRFDLGLAEKLAQTHSFIHDGMQESLVARNSEHIQWFYLASMRMIVMREKLCEYRFKILNGL